MTLLVSELEAKQGQHTVPYYYELVAPPDRINEALGLFESIGYKNQQDYELTQFNNTLQVLSINFHTNKDMTEYLNWECSNLIRNLTHSIDSSSAGWPVPNLKIQLDVIKLRSSYDRVITMLANTVPTWSTPANLHHA